MKDTTKRLLERKQPSMVAMSEMASSKWGAGTHELHGCVAVLMYNTVTKECCCGHLPLFYPVEKLRSLIMKP